MSIFIDKGMYMDEVKIDKEMNDLLDDGNDDVAEWIAELELDHIVWIPVNPSDTEVRYEYRDGCEA
jgi:hypothetical protein